LTDDLVDLQHVLQLRSNSNIGSSFLYEMQQKYAKAVILLSAQVVGHSCRVERVCIAQFLAVVL